METVTINKEILNQMDRQINFAYFLAGTIVTLALVVIAYQIVVNEKRLKKIKKENQKLVEEISAPLFLNNLKQYIKFNNYEFKDLEELIEIFWKYFSNDQQVKDQLLEVKRAFFKESLYQAINCMPTVLQSDMEIGINCKTEQMLLSNIEDMESSLNNFNEFPIDDNRKNILAIKRDVIKVEQLFKNI